jgi:hypothetical protein
VLRNKSIDHLPRHRHYGGHLEDGDLFALLPDHQIEQQEAVDQVMQHVRGKKELEELVSAISQSNGWASQTRNLPPVWVLPFHRLSIARRGFGDRSKRGSPQPPKPRKEP